MDLLFNELIHLLLSLLVGFIVWKIWGKPLASFLAALTAGFLVDTDHLIDYFLAFGLNFRLDYFLSGYHFLKSDKMYIIFHGWEYVIILLALVSIFRSKFLKSVFLALSLSLFFHLAFDSFSNEGLTPKSYSIIYRVENNFDLEKLVSKEHYQYHLRLKKENDFK